MVYEIEDTNAVSSLFGQWEETLIWSCLQKIMGKISADDPDNPTAAMAVIGDFIFFAGKPDTGLVSYKPKGHPRDFMIMIPQNGRWQTTITKFYAERAKLITRYATKKEPDVFDLKQLKRAVHSLPKGYSISMIDETLFQMCRKNAWSADLVAQFPGYEDYRKLGIGAVICNKNRIVSGASSYSRYRDGIEIQIDTKEKYRRKGLAYICGAKLILECLKRNLYPSWDAQNKASIGLAEKLGYHYSHAYTAVEIQDF